MYNFSTNWRVNILAITKDKQYAALPTARDIHICETTERYLYPMNQVTLSS